jgi:hypothetical protein
MCLLESVLKVPISGALELTRSDGQVGYAARRSVCQAASFSLGVM